MVSLLVGCGSSNGDAPATDAGSDLATTDSAFDGATSDAGTDVATDGGVDAPEQPLDCTWVNDPNNCWRTLVAGVDRCLANPLRSGVKGSLAADHASCTYSGGRRVSFIIAPTPDGEPDRADRSFTVTNSGAECLRYRELASVNGFTLTWPDGMFRYEAIGNDVHIECGDGTRYRGDAASIAKLCGSALLTGGAPGRTYVAVGGEVRFQLTGMKDVAFDCTTTSP